MQIILVDLNVLFYNLEFILFKVNVLNGMMDWVVLYEEKVDQCCVVI